jgi:Domain of unknown function (DU1801)
VVTSLTAAAHRHFPAPCDVAVTRPTSPVPSGRWRAYAPLVRSAAATVEDYLAELPPERREVVTAVRDVVNANLPAGYEEAMAWGAITWQVPLAHYPDTYNGQPLAYASLASQARYCALYLLGVYADSDVERRLRGSWAPPTGKAIDLGKSCLRFRRLEDLDLPLLAETIAAVPAAEHIARARAARAARG